MSGETLQVQRLLGISLGLVLTVALVKTIVVLPDIHRE
jgi:hypothetical protein